MVYINDVIVCDNDLGILHVLRLILESNNIKVRSQLISTNLIEEIDSKCPSVLIIDLWMPQISGMDIITYLKSDPRYSSIFIIGMSSSLSGEESAKNVCADLYLSKPFNISDLMDAVIFGMRLN